MPFINLVPLGMEQTQASVGNYYRMLEAERAAQRQEIENRRNRFASALQLRQMDDVGREAADRRMMVDRNWQAQERNWATALKQRNEDIAYKRERDTVGDTFRNDQLTAQTALRKQQAESDNLINQARITERKQDDARRVIQAELQSGESTPEQVAARAIALGLSPEEAKAFGTMTVAAQKQYMLPYMQQRKEQLGAQASALAGFETKTSDQDKVKFMGDNWRQVMGD
ncbi:MAG: hypothetical protein RL254_970, partial [Planctomycetota bacterium]